MIGNTIHEFRSVSSTNDLARTAVEHGVAEGTVYTADHQTAGQGRRGAIWKDSPGENVLMTVVLYPEMPISSVWQLGWAVCVAVIDALSSFGVDGQCKWPNDVVVSGSKIAGELVQTVSRPDGTYAALVGVGINVNVTDYETSDTFRLPFTSVRLVTGKPLSSKADVTLKVCEALDRVYASGKVIWPEVAQWYRELVLLGETQHGLEVGTSRAVSGALVDVRETDGAALLEDTLGVHRWVYPE